MGKKHDLLIDDDELLVLQTKLAVAIGDRPAIALQQIHYWIEINRKANKETHCFDGMWWMYNTWADWRKLNFPFWSLSTIRRVFEDLMERGIIKTRQHEDRNKGVWVTIDYNTFTRLTKLNRGSVQNEQTGMLEMNRPSAQIEQPTSTTENTTETTTSETTSETTNTAPSGARFVSDDLSHDVKVSVEREEPKKTTAIKEKTPTKANAAKDENPLPVPQGFPQTGKRGKRGKPTKAELAAQRVAGLTDAERAIYDVLSGQFGYQPEFDEDFETDMARVAKFNPTPESVKRYIERRKNSQWWRDNKGSAAVSLKVVADNLSEIATPSKQSNTSKPQGYRESFIIK